MNITDVEVNSDVKSIIISVVIIFNVIVNTLVIAVIVRYPELREDRATLFMLSLSVSDLASGCLPMPISAVVCSMGTASVQHISTYLPEAHMFFTWCFSFNSLHSLCWLTVCKMVALLKPLHYEQIFARKRCYGIIVANLVMGASVAATKFGQGASWNMASCWFVLPKGNAISVTYFLVYAILAVLPVVALVYATIRIFIVVVRVHKDIAMQVHAVDGATGSAGLVTLKAIRSAKNVLIICAVSVVCAMPLLIAIILRHTTEDLRMLATIGFAAIWTFNCNSFMNGLLYLLLYRSVRHKTKLMLIDVYNFLRNH